MIKKIFQELDRFYNIDGKWWPGNRFEICVGAILTQNTNWNNVERALRNLRDNNVTSFECTDKMDTEGLENMIRVSGFYKQKARRLKRLAKLILEYDSFKDFLAHVTRDQLLGVKGIGKETADSILLYACDRKEFVVDAYTKRLFTRLGVIDTHKNDYDTIKDIFERNLASDVRTYQKYHGLIVVFVKEYCKKNGPKCDSCVLAHRCMLR